MTCMLLVSRTKSKKDQLMLSKFKRFSDDFYFLILIKIYRVIMLCGAIMHYRNVIIFVDAPVVTLHVSSLFIFQEILILELPILLVHSPVTYREHRQHDDQQHPHAQRDNGRGPKWLDGIYRGVYRLRAYAHQFITLRLPQLPPPGTG